MSLMPSAFAFDPVNVVDRSGAFRLQLPFDTDTKGTYTMYINETDSTYGLVGSGSTYEREDVAFSTYTVDAPYTPLSDAYLAELRTAVPLPETMTFDQMKPYLLRAGLDVDSLITTLTPLVSTKDLEALRGRHLRTDSSRVRAVVGGFGLVSTRRYRHRGGRQRRAADAGGDS